MSNLRLAPLLVLIFTLGACGDDDGIPIEDLEDRLVSQLCERMVRCGVYVDDAACRADFGVLIGDLVSQVENGRVDYDGELAAQCLDAAAGAACDNTAEENRDQLQACVDALKGTVADGAQCFNDQECISEDCVTEGCGMACCAGTCGPTIVPAAIGQPCPNFVCVNGAFCSTTGTCTALLAAGASCQADDECGYGMFCAGTCVDAPDRGQPCPDNVCGGIGDRCDQNMTCVALSGRGGPCGGAFSFGDCQRPLVCNETTLTCGDPPAIGQACAFQCAAGAFCNNTTSMCEATKANGAECASDRECNSTFCDDFDGTPACADRPECG